MKKILMIASVLMLAGCEDLTGTLKVLKNFKANTKNGAQTISQGSYQTTLDFKRDRVVVELKTGEGKTQLTIMRPAGSTIPSNGNFEIKSTQSGQPFDVLGTNKTVEKRSEIRRGYESCQYNDYQPVCDQYGCHEAIVPRWGQQYTEYYLRTVTQDLTIDLANSASVSDVLAQFAGHTSGTEKVIVQQSHCF